MTLLLLACAPSFTTAGGTWEVEVVHASSVYEGESGLERVLVGTEVGLVPALVDAEDDADWQACTRWTAVGAQAEGDTVTFDTVGTATLTVQPEDCPLGQDGEAPGADTIAVEVIAIDGVQSGFYDIERYVEESVADGSDEADYPADWRPAEGDARRVASDNHGWLLPKVELDADHPVTYSVHDAVVRYTADDESTTDEPISVTTYLPRVMPSGAAGSTVSAAIVLPAGTLPMGAIDFVDAAGIVEAEIVVVYHLREDGSRLVPYAARLVSRDGEGVVFGADVDWTLEGDVAFTTNYGLAPEIALMEGVCREEGGAAEMGGTLSATVNGITVSEVLSWTVTEEDCPVAPFHDDSAGVDDSADPPAGCGCDAPAAGPGGALVLTVGWLRRRYTRS